MGKDALWLDTRAAVLEIETPAAIRAALASWLREYGLANGYPGLVSGSLERRMESLRRARGERELLIWTSPAQWAAGQGLTLRLPQLSLEFPAHIETGAIRVEGLRLAPADAPDPRDEPGTVGAVVLASQLEFPRQGTPERNGPVTMLHEHFQQHSTDRWSGFVGRLREAVDAEARATTRRLSRLTLPYEEAAPLNGSDCWSVALRPGSPITAFEEGEVLEVQARQGRATASARILEVHPAASALTVRPLGAAPLPSAGTLRPRARNRILQQKQMLIQQLSSPTGDLASLVTLVADPSLAGVQEPAEPAALANPRIADAPGQLRAVQLALGLRPGQALLVQGPPGTGKSTTGAEILLQLLRRDPLARILVCSHSNHGTDNLLARLLPFVERPERTIARIGALDRVAPAARPFFAASERDLADRRVVFTTIDSLGLQDIAGARLYEYVLLDEANRAPIIDSLLALARGRRWILIGDQMQLQPTITAEVQAELRDRDPTSGQHLSELSLFQWLMERGFPESATVLLDQQNRMHPDIARVVSEVFYGGRVKTGASAPHQDAPIGPFTRTVTWVDTSDLPGSGEVRRGSSVANPAEARLVVDLALRLAQEADPSFTIGVIATYAEQRDLLRSLLAGAEVAPSRALEVDTVDAFEGREKDVVLVSLVRSNASGATGFLRVEQRLNVALSRARHRLVIVGDTATVRGGYMDRLLSTVSAHGAVMPSAGLRESHATR